MRIELPSRQADRPPLATTALVIVVALAIGLVIARGTVGALPPATGEDEAWPEAPEAGAEADTAAAADTEAEADAEADTATATAPATAPAPVARGPARGSLVRGRVAYLRCEGGRSGGECDRDRAIEDAIWAQIETLPTCASAPTPGGQADLVITLDEEGPSLRARDTFADDVTRLDAASTVGCLQGAIASDAVLTASSRRTVLSFRFSLAP